MKIFASFITFLLFIGPVILAYIGWPVEGENVGKIRLYPSVYILEIYLFYCFLAGKINIKKNLPALFILIAVFAYFILSKLFGHTPNRQVCLNSMILPALYYLFYISLGHDNEVKASVKTTILMMFTFNCLMAIYERAIMQLFFPYDMLHSYIEFAEETDWYIFRSAALLGHPLTNALIMSIVMAFLLTSKMKSVYKYSLYILGMVSLFCFNSRGAIMISILAFILNIIFIFLKRDRSLKLIIGTTVFSVLSLFLFDFLIDTNLAGRFAEKGDFSSDDSSLARISIWLIFSKYNIMDMLWGLTGTEMENMAFTTVGTFHIENWFILSTLAVGLVLTVIVITLFVPLFYSSLKPYDRTFSFLLLLVTLGVASTNNSLACGVPALATFFACCYAFGDDEKIYKIRLKQIYSKL